MMKTILKKIKIMTTIFKEGQDEDNIFDKVKEDQTCRPLSVPREELPPHLALGSK